MYTLTINFSLVTPTPASGYRIKYWPTANPTAITTVTASTSPFTITGLTELSYAGTIEASCGSNQYGPAQSFSGSTTAPVPTVTVIGASAGFQPCIGGTIDDFIGGQITLSGPVAVDTPFTIDFSYVTSGNACGYGNMGGTLFGTVLAGESSAIVDACTQGLYVPSGGTMCSSSGSL